MTKLELALIEKIATAKAELKRLQRPHSSSCIVENDPEGFAPCNCGASNANGRLDRVLRMLDLGDVFED